MNNRIVIADDHPAISMTVRLLLASEGFDVVAEVDNGADALAMVETLDPSILILDIGIPVIDGLTVIRKIVASQLPVKIVVLTGLPPGHVWRRCKELGAHGFVSKQSDLSELVNAIRAVRAHGEYFPDAGSEYRRQGLRGLDELAVTQAQPHTELLACRTDQLIQPAL